MPKNNRRRVATALGVSTVVISIAMLSLIHNRSPDTLPPSAFESPMANQSAAGSDSSNIEFAQTEESAFFSAESDTAALAPHAPPPADPAADETFDVDVQDLTSMDVTEKIDWLKRALKPSKHKLRSVDREVTINHLNRITDSFSAEELDRSPSLQNITALFRDAASRSSLERDRYFEGWFLDQAFANVRPYSAEGTIEVADAWIRALEKLAGIRFSGVERVELENVFRKTHSYVSSLKQEYMDISQHEYIADAEEQSVTESLALSLIHRDLTDYYDEWRDMMSQCLDSENYDMIDGLLSSFGLNRLP